MPGKVEAVQSDMVDGRYGFGFVVRDERGKQCMTLAFTTETEAEVAEEELRGLLANALWVRGAP